MEEARDVMGFMGWLPGGPAGGFQSGELVAPAELSYSVWGTKPRNRMSSTLKAASTLWPAAPHTDQNQEQVDVI